MAKISLLPTLLFVVIIICTSQMSSYEAHKVMLDPIEYEEFWQRDHLQDRQLVKRISFQEMSRSKRSSMGNRAVGPYYDKRGDPEMEKYEDNKIDS